MSRKANKEKYKVAWLIGSAGGIGSSFYGLLKENCKNICLVDKKEAKIPVSKSTKFWKIDCSDNQQFTSFADEAVLNFGPPELMIISAGYVFSENLEKTSSEQIDEIFKNNFKIVALSLQRFISKCSHDKNIAKNIIIIGSNAGSEPRSNQPVYAAMKRAINSLVESQALAWGTENIRLNLIAPGTVAVDRNIDNLKKKYKNFPVDDSRPLGRIAFPDDLHSVFRLLLQKDILMTGQILTIDGGSNLL